MVRKCYILWTILCCVACSSQALHEAQYTVVQADSMRAEKCEYNDSLMLAQAYETLGRWKYWYADDYARACYYYGWLLREKDNPVSAMRAFISASHSCSTDYRLLGRIYSNMGSISHLAGAFSLAYDMYEQSANMFLLSNDSILYYYGLNNMAIELAEQGKEQETKHLIQTIRDSGNCPELLSLSYFTESVLYHTTQQFDSAIYYAHKARESEICYVDATLIAAQSYSYLGMKDSAVCYANLVLNSSSKLFHTNNALYILTNDDETKDKAGIRETAANRADTQKMLEIRQGKLSQAVQLLEQDRIRKPNLTWLYAIIVTLLVVGIGFLIYHYIQKHKHALWSQKVEDMTNRYSDLQTEKTKQIEQACTALCASDDVRNMLNWRNYDAMCNIIDRHFFLFASKLKQMQVLNEQEIRLCVLVFLNMSRNQVADILPYAQNGIGKFKYRVAQKLNTKGKNLRHYLIRLAIDEPLRDP